MIGQREIDVVASRAAASLSSLNRYMEQATAAPADGRALAAIANQMALANALKMVELARDAGERP